MDNQTQPSEPNEPAVVKFDGPAEWALTLACDIGNQFEIGMSAREHRALALLIERRAKNAARALDRPRSRSKYELGTPQAAGAGCAKATNGTVTEQASAQKAATT